MTTLPQSAPPPPPAPPPPAPHPELRSIIAPLVSALKKAHFKFDSHHIEIAKHGPKHEAKISIALGGHPEVPLRALGTIIATSNSLANRLSQDKFWNLEHDLWPVRFKMLREVKDINRKEACLVAYARDEDFDPEAARRQVTLLVKLMAEAKNFRTLSPNQLRNLWPDLSAFHFATTRGYSSRQRS